MESLHSELTGRGVVVIGLCDDAPENQRKAAERAGVTYPLLVENEHMPAPFGDIRGFPGFLIVDPEGRMSRPLFPDVSFVRRRLERMLLLHFKDWAPPRTSPERARVAARILTPTAVSP